MNYPPTTILASYTDAKGYAVSISGLPPDELWLGRHGRKYITHPNGQTIAGGYWMNFPEKHWNIPKRKWNRMSWEDRAALEVKEQATAYAPLEDQFFDWMLHWAASGVSITKGE